MNRKRTRIIESVTLTDSDWKEIYYALETKAWQIEKGMLDEDPGEVKRAGSETAEWAAHLREIMRKIASRRLHAHCSSRMPGTAGFR